MPITQGHGNPTWCRDETILALDVLLQSLPGVPGKESNEVHELSGLLRLLRIHPQAARTDRFRNAAGVYLKLQNLYSLHPAATDRKGLKVSRNDQEIWEEFHERPDELHRLAEAIRLEVAEDTEAPLDPGNLDEDEASYEGRVLWRRHRTRERNRTLRGKKLTEARGSGGIKCEACGLSPRVGTSEEVEEAVFEVHHVLPLCETGIRPTRLEDVAVLCANCHRRLHALARVERRFIPVEALPPQ